MERKVWISNFDNINCSLGQKLESKYKDLDMEQRRQLIEKALDK